MPPKQSTLQSVSRIPKTLAFYCSFLKLTHFARDSTGDHDQSFFLALRLEPRLTHFQLLQTPHNPQVQTRKRLQWSRLWPGEVKSSDRVACLRFLIVQSEISSGMLLPCENILMRIRKNRQAVLNHLMPTNNVHVKILLMVHFTALCSTYKLWKNATTRWCCTWHVAIHLRKLMSIMDTYFE